VTQTISSPREVRLDDLQVGELLAEGGEGKVYQLPLQPHLVLKSYRRPAPRNHLDHLVSWPEVLDGPRAEVVASSSAWPRAVVVDRAGEAVGLLLPRAPRRFAVRHRDGNSRLASLSYLTADPGHRRAAYGLDLPAPASPERIGLAYALARLLMVFEGADPAIAHGDLSTKNILWSLQKGPEVFVIDCDNSEVTGEHLARRRAMTPNWNDPAVGPGENPTAASDRYSLALVFLRVVGAANFPIQARQRDGGVVQVEVAIPAGSSAPSILGRGSPVWELCARGLSITDPAGRPRAEEWSAALESVLEAMGAESVTEAVRHSQGGWVERARSGQSGESAAPEDVRISPVTVSRKPEQQWTRVKPAVVVPVAGGFRRSAAGPGPAPAMVRPAPLRSKDDSIWPELWALIVQGLRWYGGLHRQTVKALLSSRRRSDGVKLLAICAVVDLGVAVLGGFMVAMAVAPLLGL
jgi:hypothetical protein